MAIAVAPEEKKAVHYGDMFHEMCKSSIIDKMGGNKDDLLIRLPSFDFFAKGVRKEVKDNLHINFDEANQFATKHLLSPFYECIKEVWNNGGDINALNEKLKEQNLPFSVSITYNQSKKIYEISIHTSIERDKDRLADLYDKSKAQGK